MLNIICWLCEWVNEWVNEWTYSPHFEEACSLVEELKITKRDQMLVSTSKVLIDRSQRSLPALVLFPLLVTRWASLVAQSVKNLPAMQETWFDSWVRKIPWRRKWQTTPVFLPGESHGQRSLAGCSPWGRKSRAWQRLNQPPPVTRCLMILSINLQKVCVFGCKSFQNLFAWFYHSTFRISFRCWTWKSVSSHRICVGHLMCCTDPQP